MSFITELLISALYAPLMMLMQTHHVFDILFGRDSGWATQSRNAAVLPWRDALQRSRLHLFSGWLPLLVLVALAPNQIIWLSPVLAGLCLSPLLTRHSGNTHIGTWLERHGLLLTPEEWRTPNIMRQAEAHRQLFHDAAALNFTAMLSEKNRLHAHLSGLTPTSAQDRETRLLAITAPAKIAAAHDLDEALELLSQQETLYAAGQPDLLWALHHKTHP
ncbi:hypothetical protein L0B52_07685 [Suttonella sp. R2A3]|uniref:hypothetical protein n=1 Tax=Suttonella sp. R2A3 TaxID=2908648 RepID=UPI001F3D9722|nr:hypothetical protein [Suttonella sp. R2A3]UJF24208.1 hypothetical protein L0B52_07685 [Suttonella sp. R2A3]